MKICTKCVLPETFPGIKFNSEGVCNFCLDFKGVKNLESEKKEYLAKFEALIKELRGKSDYDCTLSYSGGKDSTYTLQLLKEVYKLKVLAVTFDNGFISEQAFKNIRTVTENLGVDNVIFKADFQVLKKLYNAAIEKPLFSMKALERASSICNCCIAFVKYTTLKIALEKEIPIMAWGWSPGQAPIRSSIMRMNPAMFKSTQEMYRKPMLEVIGDEINRYFVTEDEFKKCKNPPFNVNMLAFVDYDENKIIEQIKELGWISPKDVDPNSTNCLLNAYANKIHIQKHGFHPYAFEIAGIIRSGSMERNEGIKKIYGDTSDDGMLALIKAKICTVQKRGLWGKL